MTRPVDLHRRARSGWLAVVAAASFALGVILLLLPRSSTTKAHSETASTVRAPTQEAAPQRATRPSLVHDVTLREAITVDPPAAVSTLEEDRAELVVRGVVLDDHAWPVEGVLVESVPASEGVRTTARSDGRGRFAVLCAPGEYVLRPVGDALPHGLLGPCNIASAPDRERATIYDEKRISVPRLEDAPDVELRVFRAATVFGFVVGLDGEPVDRAFVRAQSVGTGQPDCMEASTHSAANGRFVLEGVRAGHYRLQIWLPLEDPPLLTPPGTVPHDFVIQGGAQLDVGTFVIGGGRNVVRGRIVDQDGRPFEGVPVHVLSGEPEEEGFRPAGYSVPFAGATTDAEGRYELDRLPPVRVLIVAGSGMASRPRFEPRSPLTGRPFELDLRSNAGIYTAPDVVVPESRPFTLRGEVLADREWLESRTRARPVEISVRPDPLEPFTPEPHAWVNPSSTVSIEWQEGEGAIRRGTFVWICETPHPRMLVEAHAGRREVIGHGVHVQPEPRGIAEVVLRLPP